MTKVTAIKSVKDLQEILNGKEGLVAVEQGLQVFSKRQKDWTRANFTPKSAKDVIENIMAQTEESFAKLPKIGLMFPYEEGTEEGLYKPGVIVFTVSYENAMRKIQSDDYGFVFKRVKAEEEIEEDEEISNNAKSAFEIIENEEEKQTKKGGKK